MCNKLTGHTIESVGRAVGVGSDKICRQITFGADTQNNGDVTRTLKLEYRTRQLANLFCGMSESTPNGWNLTTELEAPNDASSQLQEVTDIMMTEKRLEPMENIEHISCIQTDVDWNTEDASFWVAESTDWSDQANEQLEPLTDTDGDETMMDNLGDDGARGNWCGQIEKPTQ